MWKGVKGSFNRAEPYAILNIYINIFFMINILLCNFLGCGKYYAFTPVPID